MRLLMVEANKEFGDRLASGLVTIDPAYEVTRVTHLGRARRWLDCGRRFDVAVVDAGDFGGVKHMDALGRLCAKCPDLVVLVLNGGTSPNTALEAIRVGAQDSLSRSSASPEELDRAVRCALERHRRETRLRSAALHDDLTGLLNRRGIRQFLAAAITPCATRRSPRCAVVALDLDDFKDVNDRFGHQAGDDLLILCGRRMAGCLRSQDHVGRVGGDEFAIVLENICDDAVAGAVGEKVLAVFNTPFDIGRRRVRLSASLGTAVYPHDADSVEMLTRFADKALYAAKHAGGNRGVAYRDLVPAQAVGLEFVSSMGSIQ